MNYTVKIAAWLEKHPVVGLPIHVISFLFHYITSFKWVIDLVRWMVTTGGNIAESAFLLATVYVTTNTVAHLLVTWILPAQMIATLNQVSTMAFSVLPELIIASAMKTTFDHWKLVWRSPRRVDAWIWASSYTIPTLVFLIMTVLTISTFVNFEAVNATPPQATGPMLVIRCLAGWSYGMVQILFVSIGKQGYVEALDDLAARIKERDRTVEDRDKVITTQQENMRALQGYVQTQEQELFQARMALATSKATRQRRNVRTRGKEGTRQRSAVHLVKKDEDHRENSSALGEDMHRDVNEDVNSDVRRDLERDLNRDLRGNNSALCGDVHRDLHRDVNQDLDSDQTGNITALYEDVNSDVHSDVRVVSKGNTIALYSDINSDVNGDVNRDVQSDLERDLNRDQTGNKTVHSKMKTDGSEAAKKIQRILRRNPNTGPAELAAKAGVSKRYASHVKSQFLAILEAEQSG